MASDGRLSNAEFLAQLGALFEKTAAKKHGSVYLTQKRLTPHTETSSTRNLQAILSSTPDSLLIRATSGESKEKRAKEGRVKLSTVVEPEGIEAFFTKYAELCKSGMGALKKRDKKKSKKKKTKKAAEGTPAATPAA